MTQIDRKTTGTMSESMSGGERKKMPGKLPKFQDDIAINFHASGVIRILYII